MHNLLFNTFNTVNVVFKNILCNNFSIMPISHAMWLYFCHLCMTVINC